MQICLTISCLPLMLHYVDRRDLVLLANACKELPISKCISVQSGFISDLFPWKRTDLAKVGGGGGSEG